jgi:hypothetical protein
MFSIITTMKTDIIIDGGSVVFGEPEEKRRYFPSYSGVIRSCGQISFLHQWDADSGK